MSSNEQVMVVLCLCDLNGNVVSTDTREIVQAFKNIPENCFIKVTHSEDILSKIRYCYDNVLVKMNEEYRMENAAIISLNKKTLIKLG